MTFTPRTIDEIQQAYLTALAEAGSKINIDLFQGSIPYTISRASSNVISQQEARLKEIETSSLLFNATGAALDSIGISFGIVRKVATFATGFVLIRNSVAVSLSTNTILTDLNTTTQYRTTNLSAVSITNLVETQVPIIALESGETSNLPAGTVLYSEDAPSLRIFVGSVKNTLYEGDLSGGLEKESDLVYRNRIATSLVSKSSSTESGLLLALKDYEGVSRAFVLTKVPGIVEIWIDTVVNFTTLQKQQLLDYIKPFLPVGILAVISQAVRRPADFLIEIVPFVLDQPNFDALSAQINFIVQNNIDQLTVGEPLFVDKIKSFISPLCRRVTIKAPSNIFPSQEQIVTLGVLKITYPV